MMLSRSTLELARQALGSLPAGHPERRAVAAALDELDAAIDADELARLQGEGSDG